MLKRKQENNRFAHHKSSHVLRILIAPVVVTGLLTNISPSQAVLESYRNDYRTCAAQLLSVGVPAQAVSQSCATALRPRELSDCVAQIQKQTEIPSTNALSSCRQARRPRDLAICVVGVSKSTEQAINSATLRYCGRSLLPVKFAECVVGLRKELDIAPIQSLNACINVNQGSTNTGTTFTNSPGLIPNLETVPTPSTSSLNVR